MQLPKYMFLSQNSEQLTDKRIAKKVTYAQKNGKTEQITKYHIYNTLPLPQSTFQHYKNVDFNQVEYSNKHQILFQATQKDISAKYSSYLQKQLVSCQFQQIEIGLGVTGQLLLSPNENKLAIWNKQQIIILDIQYPEKISIFYRVANTFEIDYLIWGNDNYIYGWKFQGNAIVMSLDKKQQSKVNQIQSCTCLSVINKCIIAFQTMKMTIIEIGTNAIKHKKNFQQISNKDSYIFEYTIVIGLIKLNNLNNFEFNQEDRYALICVYYQQDGDNQSSHRQMNFVKGDLTSDNITIRGNELLYSARDDKQLFLTQEWQKKKFSIKFVMSEHFIVLACQKAQILFLVDLTLDFDSLGIYTFEATLDFKQSGYLLGLTAMKHFLSLEETKPIGNQIQQKIFDKYGNKLMNLFFKQKETQCVVKFPISILTVNQQNFFRRYAASTVGRVDYDDLKQQSVKALVNSCELANYDKSNQNKKIFFNSGNVKQPNKLLSKFNLGNKIDKQEQHKQDQKETKNPFMPSKSNANIFGMQAPSQSPKKDIFNSQSKPSSANPFFQNISKEDNKNEPESVISTQSKGFFNIINKTQNSESNLFGLKEDKSSNPLFAKKEENKIPSLFAEKKQQTSLFGEKKVAKQGNKPQSSSIFVFGSQNKNSVFGNKEQTSLFGKKEQASLFGKKESNSVFGGKKEQSKMLFEQGNKQQSLFSGVKQDDKKMIIGTKQENKPQNSFAFAFNSQNKKPLFGINQDTKKQQPPVFGSNLENKKIKIQVSGNISSNDKQTISKQKNIFENTPKFGSNTEQNKVSKEDEQKKDKKSIEKIEAQQMQQEIKEQPKQIQQIKEVLQSVSRLIKQRSDSEVLKQIEQSLVLQEDYPGNFSKDTKLVRQLETLMKYAPRICKLKNKKLDKSSNQINLQEMLAETEPYLNYIENLTHKCSYYFMAFDPKQKNIEQKLFRKLKQLKKNCEQNLQKRAVSSLQHLNQRLQEKQRQTTLSKKIGKQSKSRGRYQFNASSSSDQSSQSSQQQREMISHEKFLQYLPSLKEFRNFTKLKQPIIEMEPIIPTIGSYRRQPIQYKPMIKKDEGEKKINLRESPKEKRKVQIPNLVKQKQDPIQITNSQQIQASQEQLDIPASVNKTFSFIPPKSTGQKIPTFTQIGKNQQLNERKEENAFSSGFFGGQQQKKDVPTFGGMSLFEKNKQQPKQSKKEEKKNQQPKKQQYKKEQPNKSLFDASSTGLFSKKQQPKRQQPKKQQPKKQEPKKQEPKKSLFDASSSGLFSKKQQLKRQQPKKEQPKKSLFDASGSGLFSKKQQQKKNQQKKNPNPFNSDSSGLFSKKQQKQQKNPEKKSLFDASSGGFFSKKQQKLTDLNVQGKPNSLNTALFSNNIEQKVSSNKEQTKQTKQNSSIFGSKANIFGPNSKSLFGNQQKKSDEEKQKQINKQASQINKQASQLFKNNDKPAKSNLFEDAQQQQKEKKPQQASDLSTAQFFVQDKPESKNSQPRSSSSIFGSGSNLDQGKSHSNPFDSNSNVKSNFTFSVGSNQGNLNNNLNSGMHTNAVFGSSNKFTQPTTQPSTSFDPTKMNFGNQNDGMKSFNTFNNSSGNNLFASNQQTISLFGNNQQAPSLFGAQNNQISMFGNNSGANQGGLFSSQSNNQGGGLFSNQNTFSNQGGAKFPVGQIPGNIDPKMMQARK